MQTMLAAAAGGGSRAAAEANRIDRGAGRVGAARPLGDSRFFESYPSDVSDPSRGFDRRFAQGFRAPPNFPPAAREGVDAGVPEEDSEEDERGAEAVAAPPPAVSALDERHPGRRSRVFGGISDAEAINDAGGVGVASDPAGARGGAAGSGQTRPSSAREGRAASPDAEDGANGSRRVRRRTGNS
jgi:hypothetical protein